jgi:hypothetical protein
MGAGNGLGLRAPVAPKFGPDASKCEQWTVVVERAPNDVSFFMVSGFGSGADSAKLLAGTKQRLSGLSQARQRGDDVFLMFVDRVSARTRWRGMPQRIIASGMRNFSRYLAF